MMFGTDIQKADAIQVAVHELQHQYDIEKGLVKDSKIVASHRPLVTALQGHVKELFNTNQISKDIYNQLQSGIFHHNTKHSATIKAWSDKMWVVCYLIMRMSN